MTHICISKVTIIASDNGLSPGRRQAIIWNNAGILLIGPLGTNFSGILIEIHIFSFKKMHLKMSSGKWRPYCLVLNMLTHCGLVMPYSIIQFAKHWFRKWLAAWQHQAITCWLMLTHHQWDLEAFTWRQLERNLLSYLSLIRVFPDLISTPFKKRY